MAAEPKKSKPRRTNGFQPGWKKKAAKPVEATPLDALENIDFERENLYALPQIDLKVDGTKVQVERLVLTAELVAVAIYEARGMLSVAARKLGTSSRVVKSFIRESDLCAAAVEEANEMLLDFAEAKLYQKIKAGDIASIIFYLRTRGKMRGYTEKPNEKDEEMRRKQEESRLDAQESANRLKLRLEEVRQRITAATADIDIYPTDIETDDDDTGQADYEIDAQDA